MKKPNITEGEWLQLENDEGELSCMVIGKARQNLNPIVAECDTGRSFIEIDEQLANAKAISVVPEIIDHLMCFYYHFMSQWESVNYHPSSNYLRDAHSVAETLIKAGCEPEKEDVEKFKKANIEL